MTQFPDTPRMALTATADEPTRAEILSHLQIDKHDSFIAGFDRSNIHYAIMEKDNPRAQLKRFPQDHPGESGIVYCLSKRKTEETAEWLRYDALSYHGGIEKSAREAKLLPAIHEALGSSCHNVALDKYIFNVETDNRARRHAR